MARLPGQNEVLGTTNRKTEEHVNSPGSLDSGSQETRQLGAHTKLNQLLNQERHLIAERYQIPGYMEVCRKVLQQRSDQPIIKRDV